MATPRCLLVDPDHSMHYHLVSRCVRGAWLCGFDPIRETDYSHRRSWLEERLRRLSNAFAVNLIAYAILSNHFHLIVFFDPLVAARWSKAEVVRRWVMAFPPEGGETDRKLRRLARRELLKDPARIEQCRKRLGDLSAFMQHLKQPIARRANAEDGVTGHFFEQRFYSGALLSETAVLAAMAYVDLNPVRAGIAREIDDYDQVSITRRLEALENAPEKLEKLLEPLGQGLADVPEISTAAKQISPIVPRISLGGYVAQLRALNDGDPRASEGGSRQQRWARQVAALAKRQRAYGSKESLEAWLEKRRFRRLERPFPP